MRLGGDLEILHKIKKKATGFPKKDARFSCLINILEQLSDHMKGKLIVNIDMALNKLATGPCILAVPGYYNDPGREYGYGKCGRDSNQAVLALKMQLCTLSVAIF